MLTIQEKIDLIRKLCSENNITAYELGEKTSISKRTAYNILTNNQITPRNNTLNEILDYIENRIVGTKAKYELKTNYPPSEVKESQTTFNDNFDSLSIENKLKTIYLQNQKILAMDDKLEQVAQALSILLLDTDSIKDELGIEDEVKNQLKK